MEWWLKKDVYIHPRQITKDGDDILIKYDSRIISDPETGEKYIHHYTCNAPDQQLCKKKWIHYIGEYYLDEWREWNGYLSIPLKLLQKTYPQIEKKSSPENLAIVCESFLAKLDRKSENTIRKADLNKLLS